MAAGITIRKKVRLGGDNQHNKKFVCPDISHVNMQKKTWAKRELKMTIL